MLDDQTFEEVLESMAAAHERLGDRLWRAVLPWQGRSFRVFIRRGGGFLRAEVSPFLAMPADPARRNLLMRELLHRNRTLSEARFALDDDDHVVIETVFDEESAGRVALVSALDALMTAIEAHYSALEKIL